MSSSTIQAPNTSVGWLRALRHLLSCGGECFNLLVNIESALELEPSIHAAFEQLTANHGLLTLKQVTSTVFPRPTYIATGKDPEKLFDRYNRAGGTYDHLQRKYPKSVRWGSYFKRMTCYPHALPGGGVTTINQLGEIVTMLQQRANTWKASYTITIQIPGVDGRRPRGGPCLSYIALQLQSPRVLNMLAIYRSHDFIERAYGNYLGLAYLMGFICDQTGYTLGRLSCLSSHASIANLGGRPSWPTTSELRQVVQNLQQP